MTFFGEEEQDKRADVPRYHAGRSLAVFATTRGVIRTDSTEKKKRTVRRKHGVPVNSEDCLSEASDIMCRATYRAIKLACDSGGEDGNEQTGAKSLKEYWSVLKEALSVTGSINDGSDGGSVLHVVMDECADRYAE